MCLVGAKQLPPADAKNASINIIPSLGPHSKIPFFRSVQLQLKLAGLFIFFWLNRKHALILERNIIFWIGPRAEEGLRHDPLKYNYCSASNLTPVPFHSSTILGLFMTRKDSSLPSLPFRPCV